MLGTATKDLLFIVKSDRAAQHDELNTDWYGIWLGFENQADLLRKREKAGSDRAQSGCLLGAWKGVPSQVCGRKESRAALQKATSVMDLWWKDSCWCYWILYERGQRRTRTVRSRIQLNGNKRTERSDIASGGAHPPLRRLD
jgi:hypothetical protein